MTLTYKQAGVNIDAGNALVEWIKTQVPGIGGFAGAFPLPGHKNTLLVSSTDGVGTKLKLAFLANKHDTVGIDLVAMNVNDLICCGAKPLFFLDYFACGKLELGIAKQVLSGILEGCKQADCRLLGGETAEMPGFYPAGEYDLAGFAVGAVEKKNFLDGRLTKPGDALIGIPSSGIHSNGFSLVRKVFEGQDLERRALELLVPTRIYVKGVLELLKKKTPIRGIAHVTGGGFIDNPIRSVPKNIGLVFHKNSWKVPAIFLEIQDRAKASDEEMYRTFNMGIGLILVAPEKALGSVKKVFRDALVIGHTVRGARNVVFSERG